MSNVQNTEKYWQCCKCFTTNKTMKGSYFQCDGCDQFTFEKSRVLDPSRWDVVIGQNAKQRWVCGNCRQENA